MLEATGRIDGRRRRRATGEEAVALAERHDPDVVLMDIRMPGMDGHRGDPPPARRHRVLVLTTFGLDEYIVGALRAGASGFLLKDAAAGRPRRRRAAPSPTATRCSRPPSPGGC